MIEKQNSKVKHYHSNIIRTIMLCKWLSKYTKNSFNVFVVELIKYLWAFLVVRFS